MNNSETNQALRGDITGWTTVVSGDNDVEILEHRIRVDNFEQAAEIAEKLAPLVMQYEALDSEYTIRVNLTRWIVEIRLSVPKGFWESEAQKKLAEGIVELSRDNITSD